MAIYLDNAASTRTDDRVIELMTEVMRTAWGNPSSPHPQGAAARAYIDQARTRMLAALGDRGDGEVVWTSGCSEANALAVLGVIRRAATSGAVIAMSTLEHPAVTSLARPSDVRWIEPSVGGVLDPEAVAIAAEGAALVALIAVQNEIGVVQPIAAIAAAIRRRTHACHIHVDAAQALGKIALDVSTLGADSIALAGHKLHGPKGVGALWLRRGVALEPLWRGGGQQGGVRGGTQDAASVAGLGLAIELATAALPAARARWLELAHVVMQRLAARGVRVDQLVPDQRRAPHILALGVPGVAASALRNTLASRGVYVSTGSACATSHEAPSPALAALAVAPDVGMVRLSFGLDSASTEVAAASDVLADVIAELARR
jgi:cysteine desulfurase